MDDTQEILRGYVADNHHLNEEESPQEFSKRLHLPFSDYLLLNRALTHRSFINEHPEAVEDNERLEFLGDAVLDFLVGAWLYNRFPEMSEGRLTRLRSMLVRTEQLADFAQGIDLGKAMCLGHGEIESGGRARPALLCATFEALIGALYLDQAILGVQAFINPMLEIAAQRILLEKDKDPKSLLQEWSQAHALGTPLYRTVTVIGPDHAKNFEVEAVIGNQVYGRGNGTTKQLAAKAAALAALQVLGAE